MIRKLDEWINQEWIDEINACQTIVEVQALWHHKWSPDDDFLNHTMGGYCIMRIDELKKEIKKNYNLPYSWMDEADEAAWIDAIDEINACQTVEEVQALWSKKWTPDDNSVNHTMGGYCWLRIDEIKEETQNENGS